MKVEIRLLVPGDEDVLSRVADGVFDGPVRESLATEFLLDSRHHIVVAIAAGVVVGMASAVVYIHPDKPATFWINEVGVGDDWLRRGIGTQLMTALLEHGKQLGCREAWLGTEWDNDAARALYKKFSAVEESFVMYTFQLAGEEPGDDDGAREEDG